MKVEKRGGLVHAKSLANRTEKIELCCNIDNVPRGTFCLYESIRQVWINPAESISSRGLCVSIIIGQGFKKKESYVSGVSKSSPQLEQM